MLAGAEDVGIFINYINKTLYHLILKIGFELGAVLPKRSKIIWRFFSQNAEIISCQSF